MGPKKENNPLIKGQEAEDLVKNYLKEQYRPYSVSDLILNLHNKINKVTMIKCLESLVSQNEIISKTYGKMVFYVYKEEEIDGDLEAEINVERINKIKEEVEDLSKKVKELQAGMYRNDVVIFSITNCLYKIMSNSLSRLQTKKQYYKPRN